MLWKRVSDFVYDVDLLESLCQLLNNETVLKEVSYFVLLINYAF